MKVRLWREIGVTHEEPQDVIWCIDIELETPRGERYSLEVIDGGLNITAHGELLVVFPRAKNRVQLHVEP